MSSTTVAPRHRAAARNVLVSPRVSPKAASAPAAAPATDSVLIEPVGRPRRSLPRRILNWVGNLLLLLCLAVFLLVAVGPHVFGYRTATMLTGSMEPGIMPGDVVVTTPEPASEIKVGDVISYHIPIEDRRIETHRVVKVIHRDNGNIAIRTQGDNNENVDPWTATLEGDTVWEVQTVVPKLGLVIRFMRTDTVQHGIFWFAFGGLILVGLSLIWGRDANTDETNDANADNETSGDGGLRHERA